MSKEKLNQMQLTDQNYEKAVELASLVGSFLINPKYKNLPENEKEIFYHLKRGHQKIASNTSQNLTSNLQNKKSENQNIDDLDLDSLLQQNFTIKEIDRIRELYNNPEVREIYFSEYQKRKEGFDTLKEGYKQLNKVQKIDDLIAKAKDKIIDIRVQSFSKQIQIAPIQQSLIKKIQDGIEQKENEKNEMLKYKEIAYAYRHYKLKKYKEQLDTTGFVITPSRQKIIDETIENILLGKNVLLTGPTGTGKTVLAIQAVKTIAKKLKIGFSEISGKLLTDEIINNPKTSEELDEFVSVLSGHSGITPSEFIAKMGLKGDDKGGTQTYTQLGKVLKAFVDGNVPVIDEIDLIPNDVLMRIKHLFTLKPGKYYSPQEDNNQKYKLLTTSLIATANIKSEKHPDRQETDPAIIRLFTGIEVKYLPPEETYDLALSNLMEKQGFVYGVGENSLVDENGPLFLLITALKK
ncbi:MAG: ATP-binding protein [Candidatus Absconditabacterales bacterium]